MDLAIPIIKKFYDAGTPATVRTVHYALVSIDAIPNTRSAYQGLVKQLIKYRKDGRVNWNWIADDARRTTGSDWAAWDSAEDYAETKVDSMIKSLASYHRPVWENQPYYVEVWIEKNTMAKTFSKWLSDYNVTIVPCRGYPSWSFLVRAASRMLKKTRGGREIKMLYYGDFDPSGMDIDRFLVDSFAFFGVDVDIERYAVEYDHIEKYSLPSKPDTPAERAKMARDPRFLTWEHGYTRVELDAMFAIVPDEFEKLVVASVEHYFDRDIYEETLQKQADHQETILEYSMPYLEEKLEELREEWGLR